MVSVLANPSPQPSPKGRGRLEDSEATLATENVLAHRPLSGNLKETSMLVLSFDRFDLSHAFAMTVFGNFG